MKENCPTINQTVKKPRAITEFKLSIGMDLSLNGLQITIPPWEYANHPCIKEVIGNRLNEK